MTADRPATSDLSAAAVSRGLQTRRLGRPCDARTSVGSTNDIALDLLDAGAAHGALVVADAQTSGRGRRGRVWHSPPGVAIHASLVLRGDRPLASPTALVAAVGLGIAEGIEAATSRGVTVGIKWPNDLWIGGRKVAGILVEARGFRPETPAFVAGFGINVNHAATDFPDDLADVATSLAIEAGRTFDRAAVVRHVLEALEPRIDDVLAGRASDLHAAYRRRSVLLGRRVELLDADEPLVGTVADLSATDGLLLRMDDGSHRHVPAEHVSDVRPV
ncbi:MAG: biotin--[acetyl-CoA-carboxylase] ligase [Planctomycetes bacterium]|nr:biotin--[acetyl-CoA-carboxylase] ligase [Planctomycetota bacterium]